MPVSEVVLVSSGRHFTHLRTYVISLTRFPKNDLLLLHPAFNAFSCARLGWPLQRQFRVQSTGGSYVFGCVVTHIDKLLTQYERCINPLNTQIVFNVKETLQRSVSLNSLQSSSMHIVHKIVSNEAGCLCGFIQYTPTYLNLNKIFMRAFENHLLGLFLLPITGSLM